MQLKSVFPSQSHFCQLSTGNFLSISTLDISAAAKKEKSKEFS